MHPLCTPAKVTRRDPKEWLDQLRQGKILDERELRMLCEKVKELLIEESNV